MDSGEGRSWLPAPVVAAVACLSPVVAFVLMWQVREQLNDVLIAAETRTVTVPDNLTTQAVRFVLVAALIAVIGLLAAGSARSLGGITKLALIGCAGVLLVHGAVLAPDVWLHDIRTPYSTYAWFMIAEGAMFAIAFIAEFYRQTLSAISGRQPR